jgi:hypothetical protein
MMDCQACGRPLTMYDEHRVACKGGHVWTLHEHADKPPTAGPGTEAEVRLVRQDELPFPAWLPGAVLAAVALVVAVLGLVV